MMMVTELVNHSISDAEGLQAERLRELHRVLVAPHPNVEAAYADVIATGRHILDMKIGMISRIVDDRYDVLAVGSDGEIDIRAGDSFPLANTYCAEVIARLRSVSIDCAGDNTFLCVHPVYLRYGFESYAAAPVWVNGRIYGTLAFVDPRKRLPGFGEGEVEFLEMMATALGRILERNIADRDRRLAEKRLGEAARLFGTAFDQAPIGMALVSTDGRFLKVNRALCRICGYEEHELLAIDFQNITDPEHLQTDLSLLEAVLRGEREDYRIEKRYIRKDGSLVWAELSVSLVRDEDGGPLYFVSQIQNIDDQKALLAELEAQKAQVEDVNRRLERLASTDSLTGLANRRAFMARFEEELARHEALGKSLCLVLIDIDHFKRFNDHFGHPAGDEALRRVAEEMANHLPTDCLLARHGGEEFAALLTATEIHDALARAEEVRDAVAGITDLPSPVTISIGLASCAPGSGHDDLSRAELIAAADEALYCAKEAGRNRVEVARRPKA
ncbi:diguanylate cyclase [Tistrella mobilis]|uniref:diguanylate cyclase n=1 Tax=Tistrella mobilis TaxID=171437 RepID=UPI003558BBD9